MNINTKILAFYVLLLEKTINILTYLYILGRFYKGLLYTKLFFDQIPLYSPHEWPLSIIRILTDPWFKAWRKLLPPVIIRGYAFDMSGIAAFESFDFILQFISTIKEILIINYTQVAGTIVISNGFVI